MATYEFGYIFNVTLDPNDNTITAFTFAGSGEYAATGGFTRPDSMTITGPNGLGFSAFYEGYVENGWVGLSGSAVLYFTTSSTPPDTPVQITDAPFTVCFLAGTLIATPGGEVAVENLRVGDPVLTSDGRAVPVRWVGRQGIVTAFADRLRNFPVRIAAGALGEVLPLRDLFVSPDHALLVDGVLVQAGALVNGSTVTRATEMPERFSYFHVEIEDHSLILAAGVPAETFVDNVTRRRFDNYAEYEALYGDGGSAIAELALPRIKSARQLPRSIVERLEVRAAETVRDAEATLAA
jgi:hypothetical protein